jgi:hypothetical protein
MFPIAVKVETPEKEEEEELTEEEIQAREREFKRQIVNQMIEEQTPKMLLELRTFLLLPPQTSLVLKVGTYYIAYYIA